MGTFAKHWREGVGYFYLLVELITQVVGNEEKVKVSGIIVVHGWLASHQYLLVERMIK